MGDFAILRSRLKDFFALRTTWHRRLWSIGTVLGLQEVLEYANACITDQVPNTLGLRFVVTTARREVARDPGVAQLRSELDRVLARLDSDSPSRVERSAFDELEHLTRRAEQEYCLRWKDAAKGIPVEFTARSLAAHLLDTGFSPDHLFRWLQATQESMKCVGELAEEISSMTERMPARPHGVFVPCSAPYEKPSGSLSVMRWADGTESARWLGEKVPGGESHRHTAGLIVDVEARDPWAAVETARTLIARADARAKVARPSNESISLAGWARVAGSHRTFLGDAPSRRVEVGSLDRAAAVYDFDGGLPPETDDALDLASYMESPSPGAAVTGGWAAIEALLIRPGESKHYEAADRLAALVTCSFPRAEMTPLAYQHSETSDILAGQIRAARTNKQKVLLVERHLAGGGRLTLTNTSDIAAQKRMLNLLGDRASELKKIRQYITESLRRLYNQRNIIAHSGSLRSVTLEATLRTSLVLVGAGLDRIVHAQLQSGERLSPLALVARAETELRLVGTPGERELASLLD